LSKKIKVSSGRQGDPKRGKEIDGGGKDGKGGLKVG